MSTIEHFADFRREARNQHSAFGLVPEEKEITSNKIDKAKSALKDMIFTRKNTSEVKTWKDFKNKYDLEDFR